MRMITFPFVVMSQKNMVNMNNNMPGMAALQEKMTDARLDYTNYTIKIIFFI